MATKQKTLLILGATSAVAHAYTRSVAANKTHDHFILVARSADKLKSVEEDIAARSGVKVTAIAAEIGDPSAVSNIMTDILEKADTIHEYLLAYGVLGEQGDLQQDIPQLQSLLDTNFVSAALWMESLATQFEKQSHGHAIIIGSVAGDRGRQSNYLYGATKAGLERISEGMAHRFAGQKDIHVTLVKPGFIDTPMTAHIEKSGPLWATPEQVAQSMKGAVAKKRVRIYTPWFWRFILLIVRAVPIPIFHKTKM
ncbi:MAG: SDR family NAD(P)-dependent oxidoreductase [Pseudomonadota bacterium]